MHFQESQLHDLARKLAPEVKHAQKYVRIMEMILTCIQRSKDYKIRKLICSDSVSKGFISSCKNDFECSLWMENLRADQDASTACKPFIQKMRKELENLPGKKEFIEGDFMLVIFYEDIGFALRPVPADAPFDNQQELMRYMSDKDPKNWPWIGGCGINSIKYFMVDNESENLRQLVMITKNWLYNREWSKSGPLNRVTPDPLAMELLCLHACIVAGGKSAKLSDCIMEFMKAASDPDRVTQTWSKDPPKEIKDQRPLLLDPTNPLYNVGNLFEWEALSQFAHQEMEEKFEHFDDRVLGRMRK